MVYLLLNKEKQINNQNTITNKYWRQSSTKLREDPGPNKKIEGFFCLKYSLTSVEYMAIVLFTKFEL